MKEEAERPQAGLVRRQTDAPPVVVVGPPDAPPFTGSLVPRGVVQVFLFLVEEARRVRAVQGRRLPLAPQVEEVLGPLRLPGVLAARKGPVYVDEAHESRPDALEGRPLVPHGAQVVAVRRLVGRQVLGPVLDKQSLEPRPGGVAQRLGTSGLSIHGRKNFIF